MALRHKVRLFRPLQSSHPNPARPGLQVLRRARLATRASRRLIWVNDLTSQAVTLAAARLERPKIIPFIPGA